MHSQGLEQGPGHKRSAESLTVLGICGPQCPALRTSPEGHVGGTTLGDTWMAPVHFFSLYSILFRFSKKHQWLSSDQKLPSVFSEHLLFQLYNILCPYAFWHLGTNTYDSHVIPTQNNMVNHLNFRPTPLRS